MTSDSKPEIHIYEGDGAFAYAHDQLVAPFLARTAGDALNLKGYDWSAANRIRTDGAIVTESIAEGKAAKAAVVKYPGATPDAEELEYLKARTGGDPKSALGLGNSPNAPLRGANGFDASILRMPAASSLLIEPLETHWKPDSDVEIARLTEGGRLANQQVTITNHDQQVEVIFIDAEGGEHPLEGADGKYYTLAAGSPVSITHVNKAKAEQLIRATLDTAVAKKADVMLSLKNTVLKSIDGPLNKLAKDIFDADYKAKFDANQQWFGTKIVDDGFAWLLAEASSKKTPQIMLSPDDAYGAQMEYVLAEVKKKGLNYRHTEHPVAVARFSNAVGDEYGGMHFPGVKKKLAEFVAQAGGTLVVRDKETKEEVCRHVVPKGESMWLVSAQDLEGARIFARRMLYQALDGVKITGKPIEHVLFGFDVNAKFEAPFAQAIQEEIDRKQEELSAKGIEAKVVPPAMLAAESLTNPSKKGTLLALNNLWGDIIADLYPALANNRASYDSSLISNKGFVVETGSGGTAPDLLFGRDGQGGLIRNGMFNLNPIAILSGFAQAARYSGSPVYADALEAAINKTLCQGYLTADLVNKDGSAKLRVGLGITDAISLPKPRAVDTRVFMAALEVNLLNTLGKDANAAKLALNAVKDLDVIPLDEAGVQPLAKYATRASDLGAGINRKIAV